MDATIEPTAETTAYSLLRETLGTGRVLALAAMDATDAWKAEQLLATARRLRSTVMHAVDLAPEGGGIKNLTTDVDALGELILEGEAHK